MDHPTHSLNAYIDNFKKMVFCEKCGKEDGDLSKPCAGYFIAPISKRPVDTGKEHS